MKPEDIDTAIARFEVYVRLQGDQHAWASGEAAERAESGHPFESGLEPEALDRLHEVISQIASRTESASERDYMNGALVGFRLGVNAQREAAFREAKASDPD
jgi:hypothetical protein